MTQILFHQFQSVISTLPNRIVMAPMTRSFSPNGVPGPDVAAYYRKRAEGGVGLIVTEGTYIAHPSSGFDPRVPHLYGDDAVAGWRRVVTEVHSAGGRIFPQLWHVGMAYDDPSGRVRPLGPSGLKKPGEQTGEPMSSRDRR